MPDCEFQFRKARVFDFEVKKVSLTQAPSAENDNGAIRLARPAHACAVPVAPGPVLGARLTRAASASLPFVNVRTCNSNVRTCNSS